MEYKLISATDAQYVAKAVNESLEEGWELLGSVVVGVGQGTLIIPTVYVQAMTRKAERKAFVAADSISPFYEGRKSITAAGLPDTLDTLL